MKVLELTKRKDSSYTVVIEKDTYVFDEEIILKYRLFQGNEITEEELALCKQNNEKETIKKKAYYYSLKYQKNSYEVLQYLLDRQVKYILATEVIEELQNENRIQDISLASHAASVLARNSNGLYLIRYKLKNRHFTDDVIEKGLEQISEDDIAEGREKLLQKALKKYANQSDFEKRQKIKEVFYRHGYTEV